MTSRERVRMAINFKEPDRIPIDWGNLVTSGIHAVAYKKLIDYLGIKEDITIHDVVQGLAVVSEKVLELLNVDTRVIMPNPPSFWKYEEKANGTFTDEHGVEYRKTEFYCDYVRYPLSHAETIQDLKAFKPPDPTDSARFAGLREKAKNMYEKTNKAIVAYAIPTIFYNCWFWRGYEQFMTDLLRDPTFSDYLLDISLEWHMAYIECYLKEIGDYIEIMWVGDDWGSQQGPLVNPEIFYKRGVPRLKKLIDKMKSLSRAKVANHSCGSVMWAIDGFLEAGVDILQPLQANAINMSPIDLKKKYGKRLAFHGGLDNQGTFNKQVNMVVEDVKNRIKALAPGGGYLFASGHNIQADVPPENIMAIFNTVKEFGTYPIKI